MPRLSSLLLLAALLPSLAFADDERARELFENGEQLYQEGEYEAAIEAFEAAYELSSRPALLYNIANAYERLGRYPEAISALNRYRAFATAEQRETLERRIRALERRRAEGSIEVHALETKPISGGGTADGGVAAAAPGIAVLGVGLGVAGAGGGTAGAAVAARTRAQEACAQVGEQWFCQPSAEADLTSDRQLSTASDVLFVAGGVTAGAGLVVALLRGTGAVGGKASRSGVLILPTPGGLTVGGRW